MGRSVRVSAGFSQVFNVGVQFITGDEQYSFK